MEPEVAGSNLVIYPASFSPTEYRRGFFIYILPTVYTDFLSAADWFSRLGRFCKNFQKGLDNQQKKKTRLFLSTLLGVQNEVLFFTRRFFKNMKKEKNNKNHFDLRFHYSIHKVILNLFQDLHLLKTKEEEMLNQVQHDDRGNKNKVIPEICSREYTPYVKTKRLISPTKTLGDDGVRVLGDDGWQVLGDDYTSSSHSVSMRDIKNKSHSKLDLESLLIDNNKPLNQVQVDGIGIRAFTLIELLVVVLIIGILSAVALPQYQKAVLKSRYMQGLVYVKAIKDAQEIYYLANNSYATSADDLGITIQCPNNWACDFDTDKAHASLGDYPLALDYSYDHREDSTYAGTLLCWTSTANKMTQNLCKNMGTYFNGSESSERYKIN